ncbi:MAG: ribosomal protein [Dehalococcoidia bacterium]|nr:ribosomal protein [Dehalococcoidia bacterium]
MAAKIRRNDTVVVTAGKDRGKQGRVARVMPKDERLVVEGVNMIKRHSRPRGLTQQGGIIEREAPIHVSNVMYLCASCSKPTRIGFKFLETGAKVRFCKRCGEVVD